MKNRSYYVVNKGEFEGIMKSLGLKVRRGTLDILVSERTSSPREECTTINGTLQLELWNSDIENGAVINCYPLENYASILKSVAILEIADDEVWYDHNINSINVMYMSTVTCVEYDITVKEAKEEYLCIIENV